MPMEVGTTVRTKDGEDAGTIDRLLTDPVTEVVTGCVISTGGVLGREILLRPAELGDRTADGDAIRLTLSKAELDARPDHEEEGAAKH